MAAIRIRSTLSAQASTSRPNPCIEEAISWLQSGLTRRKDTLTCADQGCGKLRHLRVLMKHFRKIVLIDTEEQLNRTQRIWNTSSTSIPRYVKSLRLKGTRIRVLSSEKFKNSRLQLDVVFNICVLDVETPKTRARILQAAHRNLREGGLLVLIVPRNDQTITVRCNKRNQYLDGHIFQHHGAFTFYTNFGRTDPLVKKLKSLGFSIRSDMSTYRQMLLICQK